MDSTLKQRLIGAAVLAALAVIFLPMLLKGPDVRAPDAAEVSLDMPAAPGQEFETRELPLDQPQGTAPAGGVLGMAPGEGRAPTPSGAAGMPVPDAIVADDDASAQAPSDTPTPDAAATPAPDATLPSVNDARVAAGNYMVTVGTFGNVDNANVLAGKLRAASLPVKADRVQIASGTAMRLRVGPYSDRAAAEAARLRVDRLASTSSKVITLDGGDSAETVPKAPASPAVAAAPPAAKPPVAKPAPTSDKPLTTSLAAPAPVVAPIAAGYAVQLSAPSVESEANALRDRARGLGFDSFVRRVDTESGVRWRVRVGPVADRSSAEALRDSVNGKLGTKGIVVANP